MSFEWLVSTGAPYLELALSPLGYAAALLYAALTTVALVRNAGWRRLAGARRWLLLGGWLVGGLAAPLFLTVRWTIRTSLTDLTFPVLGLLPVLAAALWLGRGPAALVGLATGLSLALFGTGRLTQPFEIALLGAVLAFMPNQPYRGPLAGWLRQPVVAALLGALIVAWPLSLLGIFATGHPPALASLERTVGLVWPTLIAHLGAALVAGLILQAILARWPDVHPVHTVDLVPSPWERHLSQRMLYTFGPAALVVTVLLVGVVAGTAYRVATGLVIDRMARDAATASVQIPLFIQIGRSLIRDLAQDGRMVGTQQERQTGLAEGLRAVPFFQQLLYVDARGSLVATYPDGGASLPILSSAEEGRVGLTVESGASAEVATSREDGQGALVSFIVPVIDRSTGDIAGVLIGRTALEVNPILEPVSRVLLAGGGQPGEGLIIDDQNRILLYPARPERQGDVFSIAGMVELPRAESGQVFRQRQPDGTRQIVYLLPIVGHSDWTVVITVPNEVALTLALQIAFPTLLLMVMLSALALPVGVALVRDVTVPLEELSQAAGRIAEGELEPPLEVSGEDEIGRLGRAFEQMRIKLNRRLSELERLLSVSRSVSSSLELFRAVPPILNSALDITQAAGVRLVLQRRPDQALQVYTAGETAAAMAVLDKQLLDLVEHQGTLVISQLWRASASLNVSTLQARIQSLVALPLRSETSFHGILWLGYADEHVFEQSELTFLSTLAGQAAVAVANARLFAEAEEGRRKLQAVLESTADGMIVVDNEGRIVLVNPAAERYLDLRVEHATGRPAGDLIDVPELAALMTSLQDPVSVLELPHRNGKTLLANTSTIVSQGGAITGRVTVLRDITPLKELDNIKTVFLRMVSHDLRSPLTYMLGSASMLPIFGRLNERQMEALERINAGIEHITQMTERLTHLSRLQFGEEVELELTLVDVEAVVQKSWARHEALARQKAITCQFEVDGALPSLLVDGMLYAQAVDNLVQNALKYTPEGGQVTIRAYQEDNGQVTVAVTDNGVGIRLEDQARLFEAFYRVPQREGDAPRPKGTGLGLALVRAIAEAHGGKVGVQSEFGVGSTFSITLPVQRT